MSRVCGVRLWSQGTGRHTSTPTPPLRITSHFTIDTFFRVKGVGSRVKGLFFIV